VWKAVRDKWYNLKTQALKTKLARNETGNKPLDIPAHFTKIYRFFDDKGSYIIDGVPHGFDSGSAISDSKTLKKELKVSLDDIRKVKVTKLRSPAKSEASENSQRDLFDEVPSSPNFSQSTTPSQPQETSVDQLLSDLRDRHNSRPINLDTPLNSQSSSVKTEVEDVPQASTSGDGQGTKKSTRSKKKRKGNLNRIMFYFSTLSTNEIHQKRLIDAVLYSFKGC
jgi:hypothetical protein